MKREWAPLLAILGLCITMDLLGWYGDLTDSTTYRVAVGVMIVAAYRIGQWSKRPEGPTQLTHPNPATERGSSLRKEEP